MSNYSKAQILAAIWTATFSLPTANAGTETQAREANSNYLIRLHGTFEETKCPLKCGTLDPTAGYLYIRPAVIRQFYGGSLGIKASDTLWLYRSPSEEGSLAAKVVFDKRGEPFLILEPPESAKSLDNLSLEDLEKMWGKASPSTTTYRSFFLHTKDNYRVEIQADFKQKKLAKYRVRIETFESLWAVLDENKPDQDERKSRYSQSNNLRI